MTDTLVLGSFSLTQPLSAGRAGVEAQGTSKGAPQPIDVAVKSWLQDGSIVVTQGYDNRDVPIRVRLWAGSLTALNQAEALLFAELGKPNLLTWTPSSGPAAVFVVITSSMVQDDTGDSADLLESQRLIRTYNLRLTCEAFTRSATETVTTALPATGTTTTVLDACSATTGWAGLINGGAATVSTSGGAISISQASPTGNTYVFSLTKTFAATTTATKLLAVDWKPSIGGGTLTAIGDGVSLPLMAEGASPTSGYIRSWFNVAASSLAVTSFIWTYAPGDIFPLVPSLVLSLDNVSVTNVPPVYGSTGRQQMRSLALVGSARTSGSVAVEASTSLGQTLIYTYPADDSTNGYTPALRQFRTAGNAVTSDSALVSGSRESIGGSGMTLQVPLNLLPRGMYVLVVRLGVTGAVGPINAVTLTRSTVLGSNTIGSSATVTPSFTVPGSAFNLFVMSRLSLPTSDMDQFTPAKLQLVLQSNDSNVLFDEGWLFNTSIGALTWVDCGSGAAAVGGPAKRLFMESPTVATPRPTLRIGHSADRSDAFYPVGAVTSWQGPRLTPPMLNVLAVTTNATDAVISVRYKAAWHTNPSA